MGKVINHRLERGTSFLVAIVAGLSLALVWVLFLYNSFDERDRLTGLQKDRLVRDVKATANQLGQWNDSCQMSLELIHDELERHPGSDPWADRDFQDLLKTIEVHIDPNVVIQTILADGTLRPLNGSGIGRGLKVGDKEFFHRVPDQILPYFNLVGPVKSKINGQWGTILWIPAPTGEKRLTHLFVFQKLSDWKDHLGAIGEEHGVTTTIYRSDGTQLCQFPQAGPLPGAGVFGTIPRLVRENLTSGSLPGPGLTAFQQVHGTDLWVVANKSTAGISQWWERRLWTGIILVTLVTVLLTGSAVWLIVMVVRLRKYSLRQEALARTDALTGLLNRRAFFELCSLEQRRAGRQPVPLGLILFDLDHFKQVNDEYGHPAGDQVLRDFAEVLFRGFRVTDATARIGGEEFAVLLVGSDLPATLETAERIRSATESIRLPRGPVTTSAGAAVWDGTESLEDWFHRTDQALYRAKGAGRNRVES